MPAFPKPDFDFTFDVAREKKNLRTYRDTKPGRQIPARSKNKLLLATWNIANQRMKKREAPHYKLLAETLFKPGIYFH